ncbi:23S rRNA (guanosine(2251)-2'-O)-methyltransferase RlmB [uncultured Selenomonas sp.]|uniref:23S rRNA (guanosine(2251)-2'-O)-methyltransferase RlmB n=1 Tax=uncultured Selenomonas sp. TaxID=159275 RepID=UPI0025E463EE|nr:23S rRNA (guanosine(2251)-2'-O)-methyltransferase RlmB [uncultured Selenomonas sp.]
MDRKGQYKQPKHEKNNRWAFQPNKASQESRQRRQKKLTEDVLIGRNAVVEALKAGRGINKILLAHGDQPHGVQEIVALAKERGVVVQFVERSKIETLAAGHRHQGVLAFAAPVPYVELDEILARAEAKGEPPFLLLLDELEDPHNLGALLRTADATGVHGILIPKRRSVPLNATVAKTSAGAVEYVPVARIGNVAQTLKLLKERGCWVVGADMDGTPYDKADLTGPMVLVVGSEGKGMSRLTRETCDVIVSLPMVGKINSLNASVAGSILMYESLKQRLSANR